MNGQVPGPEDDAGRQPGPPGHSLLRTLLAVAWAILGVRKGSEYAKDFAHITPLHVIIVGLVAIVGLVLALILLVQLVV
ncbi:DUF2970 domain-containing protein [Comamonas terrae]|uniref:DUF2970 domain-containing protein n=1 Tax=Comamonas terrae TaxID=673548 RepID=A0ABW5UPK1_9BURK|nr:DUF2970 domain-containing protein [Comamonas terrae]